MFRRLAAALLGAALAACSAPVGKTCSQASDCGAGLVCSAGQCQVAIDTGIANGPAPVIATTSASFDFSSTPAGAGFECSLDGAGFAACPAHLVLAGLAEGRHDLDVRARSAENVDATPATWAWVVDSTPPDATIDSGPTANGVVVGGVAFAFSSPDPTATFECSLDAGAFAPCTSPQSFAAPVLGNHTFQVRARDPVGNTTPTPAQRAWSTAADTSIMASPPSPVASASASFAFMASDPTATFECALDGGAWSACTSPKSYSGLADGPRNFQVRAVGGGVADPTPASCDWTVDTTGPTVNLTGTPAATQSENPTFTFSSPEASATFECRLDAGVWAACSSPVSYVVPTNLTAGSHTFYVRGKDVLGNYTASPASYPWSQAPETTLSCAPLAATNRTTEKVAFGSNVAGATFECQLDAGAYTSCTSPVAFASLSTATHTVSVRAIAGGVTDPTPATTSFAVAPTNALLYYNFEGSTTNGGVLPGYPASLAGATPPTYVGGFVFSHGSDGSSGLSLPGSAPGWVTIPGVRNVLSHDCVATDAKYTISLWYWEPASPLQNATILDTRQGALGGGFETYHGASGTAWTTCFDTTPSGSGCFSATNPGTGTAHRLAMEYAYDSVTGGYDMKLYFDGVPATYSSGTGQTTGGQTIFNTGQMDLEIGRSWSGYIDAVRIYNTTMGGTAP